VRRRRLDADSARELILDAAEKRLVTVGPSGIRLQDVAVDAGVSHPTVLHHFGSRELLVKAVVTRSMRSLHTTVVDALSSWEGDPGQLETMIADVTEALEKSGHSRVMFWLALEGHPVDDASSGLGDVIAAAHAMRQRHNQRVKKPQREETARIIVWAALTVCAASVLGPSLFNNAGLPDDAADRTHFTRWIVRSLIERFG
jgi:AcrR family transcriptional regulator